jgi:A/G-specific adenine glycosylase
MASHALHRPALNWYSANARDLPWRRPGVDGWAVLVSEVMLQQTPVPRVLGPYDAWLKRWPTPAALAADSPGEAVRMWGRLGYPRRALRLHAAAQRCVDDHGGRVPSGRADLEALPGVGPYTAAAVAAFAYRQRQAVLDTNVRRVLARVLDGLEYERPGAATGAEIRRAEALLPGRAETAATWSVAVMELGALICTAKSPACDVCPLAGSCAWKLAGRPGWTGKPRRGQTYAGTDRQARGRLLERLRETSGPVRAAALEAVWKDPDQRTRALDSLVADGLVESLSRTRYRLPR